jgi:hypothetical protein
MPKAFAKEREDVIRVFETSGFSIAQVPKGSSRTTWAPDIWGLDRDSVFGPRTAAVDAAPDEKPASTVTDACERAGLTSRAVAPHSG